MERVLQEDFVRRMRKMYGEGGCEWLSGLPKLVRELSDKWGLEVGEPFPGLSYGWVAPAKRGDEQVVLKLAVPTAESLREPLALRAYAGKGAVRLLDFNPALGAMLLECLDPGEMAVGRIDAIGITCAVMPELWAAAIPRGFPDLRQWTRALEGPFAARLPEKLVNKALVLREALLRSPQNQVLLHGDLHHFNVLSSGEVWKAIDPKGVVGEQAFECASFLINAYISTNPSDIGSNVSAFARRLHLDGNRILGWAAVFGVLSAAWTLEDHGTYDTTALGFSNAVFKLL